MGQTDLQFIFIRREGVAVIIIGNGSVIGSDLLTLTATSTFPVSSFIHTSTFLWATVAALNDRKVGTGNARPQPAKVLDIVIHIGSLVPVAHPSGVIIAIDTTITPPNIDVISPKDHLAAMFNYRSALDPNPKGHGGTIMDAKLPAGSRYRRAVTVGNINRP